MDLPTTEQINIRDYLRVILKRRWAIIAVFAVVVVSVTIYVYTATPIYKATSRLIIDKENPNVMSIQEVMAVDASGTDYYQTQYKIIESRNVARAVIKRLSLDKSEEFVPKPRDTFLANLKHSVQKTAAAFEKAVVALLRTREISSSQALKEHDLDYKLVSAFINRIKVNPISNSRLVDVGFEAKDPVLAAKITNTLAQAYIEQNLDTKLKAVKGAVRWLNNRVVAEREKVEKSEQALLAYKSRHSIVTDFTSDVEKITAQKLAHLNTQIVEAESVRVEAETRYKQALALKQTPDMLDSIPEVLKNELIQQIKSMEVELYKRISELSKKYGQKHPQMVAIQAELQTLQKRKTYEVKRVVNSLNNEYRVVRAKEESLKTALTKQRKESLDLNQKAIEYGVLQREVESARQMYQLLINRFKETSLTEDMKAGNIRILDRAEVPKSPVKPRKQRNILMAVLFGLAGGLGLAFFLEYLDNTIKDPEDIKRYLNIPYLGPVPVIVPNDNPGKDFPPEMVVLNSPKSTASEAYRGIRTNILFSSAEFEPQVIMVTSSGPQEGKTITSSNLAITMAQSGNKVVLLDCDMRRPRVNKLFGISRNRGMTNLLVEKTDLKLTVFNTSIPNLHVIPSGPIPPNPSEILGSKRMEELIEVLRKNFTRIIIDTPPITAVTDAALLGKLSDGVVLVVRANRTVRDMAKTGLEQLTAVGAKLLGVVLNGVSMGRGSYYYYQYYYYYGDEGYQEKKSSRKKKTKSTNVEDAQPQIS
ncbi:MAG: polysaccharide biosynthesis tyrosine autokinase [Desulfobacterales bacterium]|uniref:non-specific protein-tyrosine kinase n=1 Tax=Candidatus Desulfatibia vada TaxID=2841696 RepID=A0A8J6P452_9BACT|nr:polysaccharide biosynthesis tyrosine autokinase [Candidatus Desulfatibia vada]MBL6971956.1 polysaccharide biosynthesis tyrosine autokinase [Desulfobacterales bacterium]